MEIIALLLALLTAAPECKYEDGSTQSVCVWEGNGKTVVNIDHGRFWLTLDGERP